ncbi:tRNA(Glu)-specific nuclease WapA precursor [compost metagenome]
MYNGHGDVVQVIDENGTVVNKYQYDEWGNILQQEEKVPNSFKYAGELQDEETGLYYLRARYYDPSIGRFISKDTYEGDVSNPLSLNQYTYVTNNPLIYIDPTGQWNQNLGFNYTINELKNMWANATTQADRDYYSKEAEKIRVLARKKYSNSDIMQSTDKMIPMDSIMKTAHASNPLLSAVQSFMQGVSDFFENHPGESAALSMGGMFGKLEGAGNVFKTTENAANTVGKKLGGTVTELKNGWKVEIPNGKKPIVVRIMNEGSGGRSEPYFRVSIDGKGSFTLDGKLTNDKGLTHINMSDDFLKQITKIVNSAIGK